MPGSPKFVTTAEAGRLVGRSPRTIKRLVDRGLVAASRIPGCHDRVLLASVERLIPSEARDAAAAEGPAPAEPALERKKRPVVRGRPFQPGVSGNPLGRPPGAGKKQGPGKTLSVGTDRNG
jgi:hypothetical protein